MTNWSLIEETLTKITDQMGGDADKINNGDCAVWAKKSYNALLASGIEAQIVSNLSDEMQDELEGYETIEAEYYEEISHCYIKIDGWFFDAFDIEGCEKEQEMQYHYKCLF
jgi:hypothetical protein